MTQKTVGILGGMGPESTAELFLKIIRLTAVEKEQDHLRIVIDNNPKVPDRTEALLSGDTGTAIALLAETARNLERAGAELIGMPCNTAHAFLGAVRAAVAVPVLDMIGETAQRIRQECGGDEVVGLLATLGTVHTGLYHDALSEHGVRVVVPRGDSQGAVTEVISGVKTMGVTANRLQSLAPPIADVVAQGAKVVIAGCTEISLVLAAQRPQVPWFDPLQVLAERLVEEATDSGR